MALVKAKVSTTIERVIPDFIQEDHSTFVTFLKAYYEYLEQIENRNLENTRDIDSTLDTFLDYFFDEIMSPIPKDILADERLLAKHVKDLYLSKGNQDSYKLLFRLLYGIQSEIYTPKADILRVSDGKFSSDTIIRAIQISGDPMELIGQKISQGADTSATVENVIKTFIGDKTVFQIYINPASIIGSFVSDEEITGLSNLDGSLITASVSLGVVKINIEDKGLYYTVGDKIKILSAEGHNSLAEVSSVTSGSIKEVQIQSKGSGYKVGDEVYFDTGVVAVAGSSLIPAKAVVSEVDANSFLMENGNKLLTEDGGDIDIEGFLTGGIKKVTILDSGENYKSLPRTYCTPSQLLGEEAKLIAISDTIGKVRSVSILNQGLDYVGEPITSFNNNIIFRKIDGEFSAGEKLVVQPQTISMESSYDDEFIMENGNRFLLERQVNASGNIKYYDVTRNLYKLTNTNQRITFALEREDGNIIMESGDTFVKEDSGQIKPNMTLVGESSGAVGKIASGASVGAASGNGQLGVVYTTPGNFINSDGKISDSSKRVQDSKFYQDYSYQIRSVEAIDNYRDIVRKLLHPIGLALFGALLHENKTESHSNVPIDISFIRLVVKDIINNSIRAMGNYNSSGQDFPEIKKSQWTIIIFDWLRTQMQMIPLNPEFLPEIEVPRLTPEELHLLDLRVDAAHGDEWFFILLNIKPEWLIHRQTTLIMSPRILAGSRGVGPCWDSLERFKFTLEPFEAGSKGTNAYTLDTKDIYLQGSKLDIEYSDPTTTGNTQNGHYADVVIGEVINNPYKKTNFAIDSFINIIAPITYDTTYVTEDSTDYLYDNG